MLESIEKLRAVFDDCTNKAGIEPNTFDTVWITKACAVAMVDEIEQEIAERYMALPVDADGVPWHVGDVTENGNIVNGICFDRCGCHFSNTRNDIDPSIHRHAKPKTLEDVLCNMIDQFCLTNETKTEVASKCAKEIREMIGGEL